MTRKVLIVIVGAMVLVSGGALSGFCGDQHDMGKSSIYGALVDDYIQKCEAKAAMLNSRSSNIRESAIRATVKGAYLQSNRTTIISYLMAENAPLNADRVVYHLNQKYAQSVYPQEVYAALLKDHVTP